MKKVLFSWFSPSWWGMEDTNTAELLEIRNILKPINEKTKKPLKIFRRLFTNVHYTVIQCQSSSKSVLMIMLVFKAKESLQKCKHLEWDLRQCSLIWQIFFPFFISREKLHIRQHFSKTRDDEEKWRQLIKRYERLLLNEIRKTGEKG